MKPTIRIAQRACEAAKARQAVVVWFDEHGQYAVASYGETKAECTAVKPVCNAIGDMLDSGYLEPPGLYDGDDKQPDRRRGVLGGWNEYDKLRRQRDEAGPAPIATRLFESAGARSEESAGKGFFTEAHAMANEINSIRRSMRTLYHAALLGAIGCAQGAPIPSGTLDMSPSSAPAEQALDAPACERVFSPEAGLEAATQAAAERWSAATGCDVHLGEGGWWVLWAGEITIVDAPAGTVGLGATYPDDRATWIARDQSLGDLTFTVTHEMGHALRAERGHADSGLMAAAAKPGALIDDASLSFVCATLPCEAFNPEEK